MAKAYVERRKQIEFERSRRVLEALDEEVRTQAVLTDDLWKKIRRVCAEYNIDPNALAPLSSKFKNGITGEELLEFFQQHQPGRNPSPDRPAKPLLPADVTKLGFLAKQHHQEKEILRDMLMKQENGREALKTPTISILVHKLATDTD